LIGFFIGNLVSTIAWNYWVNKVEYFRWFFIANSIAFAIILISFSYVSELWFFAYALALGLLGGGLPSIWIQVVAKNYGTNQRNTATNILYVLGRGSSIIFNLLISTWLISPKSFGLYCIITTIVIAIISIIVVFNTGNVYKADVDYLE
jgi:MFS family permease